ncbi:response regulator [Flavobacterium enshiense]|uniref:Response regulatory domain-containing protein n=2 Tax=Flavobacterium TaxID=237 RepID=A0A0A2N601_9FLAO|nr:response regulator [Flavobacterium enshiense]KGO95870.1 hypothetical protein Q767_09310 [Flavobacterium enshiense DK69]
MKMGHIMLIDDNQIDNFITNHIVEKSGIAERISLMNSAIEALKHLESIKEDYDKFPDLIFLDISMPVMDGFGFLDKIVNFPKVSKHACDIVMLTSSNDAKDIERASKYGIVKEYFVKPLKKDMLDLLVNHRGDA